ncbi:MAG TPA: hypothetical protein PKX05_00815 [bacterium]|nr:hypothetical protein [bacterium]
MHEYIGCLHIHINQKINKHIPDTFWAGAQKTGLDFLILSPHTPSKKQWNNYFSLEGYKNNLLVLAGEEADEKSRLNHLLIYGNKSWMGKQAIENIVSQKNNSLLMFAAHPYGKHTLFGIPVSHKWTKKKLFDSITGIEVWSALFDFAEKTNPLNLPLRYLLFPNNFRGPSAATLRLWDDVVRRKKFFVGVSGLDMHFLPFFLQYLDLKKTFRFDFIFKTLRNHIFTQDKITGDFEKDRDIVIKAFKQGRVFFANDFIADSRGFFFGSADREKTMGDILRPEEECIVELPQKGYINIKSDSQTIYSEETKEFVFKPHICGAWRVEVFYNGKPWIFSNHLFVQREKSC